MRLKVDAILLQYNFYQFQYFITACLYTVEIYQEIFQSNKFNQNGLMVLFNWGWSRLINKLQISKYQNDQILVNSYIEAGDQVLLFV